LSKERPPLHLPKNQIPQHTKKNSSQSRSQNRGEEEIEDPKDLVDQ
jgi:hypothetical protein